MKLLAKYLLILPLCVSVVFAQTNTPAPAEHVYTQPELDQMLAPIALYPDSLLSQILMAATYPLEVVQAARWSRANTSLKGDAAVRAVDDRNWDPSVKSLVAFPRILQMMDEKLEWTERLGDAFLAQQPQVMDTIQGLREKAYAAGNLQSNDQVRVVRQDGTILIEPANVAVVYVPYYNPTLIYGPWWWPAYPPVYWAPWPGYYVSPGYIGVTWGIGIGVGVHFFFGAWDWHRHDIRIVDARPFYYHRVDRRPLPPEKIWRHDPEHRRGVPYRNPAVRERYRHVIGSPERRREFRGFIPRTPESRPAPRTRTRSRPAPGSPPRSRERHAVRPGGDERLRPNTPIVRPAPTRPVTPGPIIRRVPEQRPNAFEGIGRGRDERRFGERGRESLQRRSQIRSIVPAPQLRERMERSNGVHRRQR
jgi:hypothetical protein